MRALTFRGVQRIGYEQAAEPRLEAAGDVIVEVEVAGLCGSDLHAYFGRETGLDVGTVMGHEFVGRVVERGDGVTTLPIGARVVAPFTTSCGKCRLCAAGLTARCESGELFGWVENGRGLHGAQAELVRVPLADTTLVPVAESVPVEAALLCGDILSTGLFCADMAGVNEGSIVAVLGCGPVGLMAIVAARRRGAQTVMAVDSVAERLELARRLGAQTVELAGGVVDQAKALTGGLGVDAVLEVVGSAAATRLAVELVRPGGVIAAAGVHTESHLAFSPGEAYDKNLTYRAGRCPARSYLPEAIEIARDGPETVTSIVTHRLSLADGPGAYEMFAERRDGCVKVLFYRDGAAVTS